MNLDITSSDFFFLCDRLFKDPRFAERKKQLIETIEPMLFEVKISLDSYKYKQEIPLTIQTKEDAYDIKQETDGCPHIEQLLASNVTVYGESIDGRFQLRLYPGLEDKRKRILQLDWDKSTQEIICREVPV